MPATAAFRPIVFALAALSFACLLGAFFNFWTMHWFGCWVLPPATLVLIAIASVDKNRGQSGPRMWIVQGAIGGLIAAIVYDLYRVPFVLAGKPLFNVFPQFGLLLAGASKTAPPQLVHHLLGWAYHFSNGAALGIMFLAMVPRPTPRVLLLGAIAWALVVEGILLCTPYPTFFGLKLDSQFVLLTATAHAIFGSALGLWLRWRLPKLMAKRDARLAVG